MTTDHMNKFELLAFESAVKENLACETAARALVDYLQDHDWSDMQACLHVRQVRRAECERRHYRECKRHEIHAPNFRLQVGRLIESMMGRGATRNRPWYIIAGTTPPLVENGDGWVIDANGMLRPLRHEEMVSAVVEGREVVRTAVFVGATWIARRMGFNNPDIG